MRIALMQVGGLNLMQRKQGLCAYMIRISVTTVHMKIAQLNFKLWGRLFQGRITIW